MSDYDELYEIWINKIVDKIKNGKGYTERGECGIGEIVEHLRHHFEELDTEHKGVPSEGWIISMITLFDICSRFSGFDIDSKKQVERLYEHWLKDPKHAEPPPVECLVMSKKEPEIRYVPSYSSSSCRES